jgi:hypothetical protein
MALAPAVRMLKAATTQCVAALKQQEAQQLSAPGVVQLSQVQYLHHQSRLF